MALLVSLASGPRRPAAAGAARRAQGRRRAAATRTGRVGATCSAAAGSSAPTAASGCATLRGLAFERRLDGDHRTQRLERRQADGRRLRAAVGWYRKDFDLPASAPPATSGSSASSRSTTARRSGSTATRSATHTGAFLPFEVMLPRPTSSAPASTGSSLRVSDAHTADRSAARGATGPGAVVGGWWNYGGLLREVYLGASTQSTSPASRCCRSCVRDVRGRDLLLGRARQRRRRAAAGGAADELRRRRRGARHGRRSRRARARRSPASADRAAGAVVAGSPHLYAVTLDAARGGARRRGADRRRALRARERDPLDRVVGGQLFLNFQPLHVRGVGLVEDSPAAGSALSPAPQQQLIDAREVARGDDDPLAVPALRLRGAARRRARDHALVGDPGLPGPRPRARAP